MRFPPSRPRHACPGKNNHNPAANLRGYEPSRFLCRSPHRLDGINRARQIDDRNPASAPMLMDQRDERRSLFGGLTRDAGCAQYLFGRRAIMACGRPCVIHSVFDRVALYLIGMGGEGRQGVEHGGLEVIKELRSGAAKGQY